MHPTELYARRLALATLLTAGLAACSSDSNDTVVVEPPQQPEPELAPFQVLFDQGVDRYLGQYTPMMSETDGDVVNHSFGTGDGPLCLDGNPYIMSTRDVGSEDLVIYLQGGGACWSELCLANQSATPGIPAGGILNPDDPDNPFREWNVAYFNYCDGGLHISDRDIDSTGDGIEDRRQRGLHNTSAGLDVTAATFPAPRRIVLTGVSAGGFGTTWTLPLVRRLYPGVPIDVINDSGVGVGRPDDPGFVDLLAEDWNLDAFLIPGCPEACYPDGHLTDYLSWQLDQDPDTRLGLMSHKQDAVIALTFSMVGGDVFEDALLEEMAQIEELQPERARSFIRDGDAHTFLGGDLTVTAGA
jgi:hypothetical protein